MSIIMILERLGLAVVLGGLVGLEREIHGRAAGFRTHILVCIGAALIMLVSIHGFPGGTDYDPGRLAAQVVSGIGFLGAGTIMREGASVRGLTTAASLWVVAGVGLAAGSGFFLGAVAGTLLTVVTLQLLNRIEHKFFISGPWKLEVSAVDRPGLLARIAGEIGRHGGDIRSVTIAEEREHETVQILFVLQRIQQPQLACLVEGLRKVEGVNSVGYK